MLVCRDRGFLVVGLIDVLSPGRGPRSRSIDRRGALRGWRRISAVPPVFWEALAFVSRLLDAHGFINTRWKTRANRRLKQARLQEVRVLAAFFDRPGRAMASRTSRT